METTIVSILGGIILRIIFPDPIVMLKSVEPDFLRIIPPGHYVGISSEQTDLIKAKDEAIFDAIKQIFLRIGSEYHIEFNKSLSGNRRNPDIKILDSININSSGILADISVVKIYSVKKKKKHRVYCLVFFPESKIIKSRNKINMENNKRMTTFNSYIKTGKDALSGGDLESALRQFRFAFGLTDDLFTSKGLCKNLSESHINETLELISIRDQQIKEEASRKPILKVSPLVMTDKCFTFVIAEVNGKDISFDRYSVNIHADYNYAKLISYYVMKVDIEKDLSRFFDFIQPVHVKKNSTRAIMIPFNSWVRESINDISSYVLGNKVSYKIVLHSGDISVSIR